VSGQRYCTALQYWASAKLCGVEQRAPPIFGRAAITLGIGPHSSYNYFTIDIDNPDENEKNEEKVESQSLKTETCKLIQQNSIETLHQH